MKSTRAEGPFRPTKLTLVAMLLTSMLMLMGGAAVAPALPLIQEYFSDSSEFMVSLVITLPSLAVAVTGLIIGGLSDRFGKVNTLVVSLVVFTIGGVASYFLDDLVLILVMRFILGVGIGGLSSAVTALMAEYYVGASRVKVLGYQSAAMGIGALVLETAGGSLASIGWNAPFLIYLIGIPILILCVVSMKEPAKREAPSPEELAQPKRKANMKTVAICYAAIFMCQMIFFLLPTKLPTFLEDPSTPDYISTTMVGLFLGVTGIMQAVVSVFYRRIVAVIRPFMVMCCGFLVMGFGLSLLLFSPTVPVALLAMILAGCAVGLISPAVTNTLAGEASSSNSGKIMGGYSTFMNFGQFAISLVSVPLLAYVVNDYIPDLCGLMGVVALVIALLFILYCAKDRRFRSAPQGE